MAIVIDSTSNSGVKAAVSNYSWNHTVAGGVGRYLVVTVQCRDNDNPTNRPITGITAGGVAMTLAKAMLSTDADGDDIGAEIWVLPNPAVGTISISVTYTGTVDHSGASAISFFNVKQSTTVNATGENEETTFGVDPSVAITTTVNGCYIIDSCYTQDSNNYTAGTDQTIVVQLGTNGGGDRAISSYKLKATAGATTMSWTNGGSADQNVQVVIAIEPATIQYDTTSTASDSADPTTLTWSHTTTTESNRLLVVGVSAESDTGGHTAQTVSGITYNGVALTKIRSDYVTDNGTELWYLVAPATGANNVVITMTAVVDGLYGAAMTFSGVDQSSPIDNNAGTTATNTVISQSLTTVAADAMIVNIMQHQNSASVHTPDTNQTQRFNAATTGDFSSAGGTRLVTTATSYTTSWTTDISDAMTLSIASLRPYALSSIKTIMGLAIASVKTVNGLAIASIKNWNGLA